MNNTQLKGIRNMWEDSKTVIKHKTLTAKEMALRKHNLSKDGESAVLLSNGSQYVWDQRFRHWVLWKLGTKKTRIRKKYYVGMKKDWTLEAFLSEVEPAQHSISHRTHGHIYRFVVGPFRTKRGALFFEQYGHNNPHCCNVSQTERLAKSHPEWIKNRRVKDVTLHNSSSKSSKKSPNSSTRKKTLESKTNTKKT